MYATENDSKDTSSEESEIRYGLGTGRKSPLLKSTCKVIGRSPGSGSGPGGNKSGDSKGSGSNSSGSKSSDGNASRSINRFLNQRACTINSGTQKNPLSRGIKASVAMLTVSASIIGAFSTLAGFTSSLIPIARPAPVMASTMGPIAVGSYSSPGSSVRLVGPVATTATIAPGDLNLPGGPLGALGPNGRSLGQCPLKSTTMNARLSGYVARVNVTQVFTNPFKEKIEAIYNLPLSNDSAVDGMTIQIGERKIKGEIKTRQQAKETYERARDRGNAAALLDQERTNIFTQHVANIEPGKSIVVNVSYVELLKFENGRYTFTMPTTIGERFNPGSEAKSRGHSHNAGDTLAAALIGTKAADTGSAQNLSINVDVDAGMPIKSVKSKNFPIIVDRQNANHSIVSLRKSNEVPNKDFVLTYEVDKPQSIKSGYLAYRDPKAKDKDGYATFMLLPPQKVTRAMAAPKEMVFLIDCSGSQMGAPIQKAKETVDYIIDHMNPEDTIQILAFNSEVMTLGDMPIKITPLAKEVSHQWVARLRAGGGTWMAPAVDRVLHPQAKPIDDVSRLRIVTFMTDGFACNDLTIMNTIKAARGDTRWFPFGTGDGVNHTFIDGIAKLGGGEADYVNLNDNAASVGKKFYDRISSPALTNVKLKAEGIKLYDVFPGQISDVWANKPLYFTARYKEGGHGKVVLSGYQQGHPYEQTLDVVLPEKDTTDSAIEKIWARQKIESLSESDLEGLARGEIKPEVQSQITAVALQHRLMSDFTSFVAVEEAPASASAGLTIPIQNISPDGQSDLQTDSEERPIYTTNPAGAQMYYAPVQQPQPPVITQPPLVITAQPAVQCQQIAMQTVPPSPNVTQPAIQVSTSTAEASQPARQNAQAASPPPQPAAYCPSAASLPPANQISYRSQPRPSSAPLLQGATNGSIGEQTGNANHLAGAICGGTILGANTSGTVRVNNLANLEAMLNILANIGEVLGIAWGGATVVIGLRMAARKKNGGYRQVLIGIAAVAAGLSFPGLVNFLAATARDLCLFN